ncbi:MAG: hypothetical protein DPW16_03305 [Chloroflexi bacterium]|nr:hypothetical protein [Chloroflexota bacterium]
MNTVSNPSALFLQAMQQDSNLEMDWWWLIQRVSSPTERVYCLERILHINPTNKTAQRELKVLQNEVVLAPVTAPRGLGWRLMGQREVKA